MSVYLYIVKSSYSFVVKTGKSYLKNLLEIAVFSPLPCSPVLKIKTLEMIFLSSAFPDITASCWLVRMH